MKFIELTEKTGDPVTVNADNIRDIQGSKSGGTIFFLAGVGGMHVEETPGQVTELMNKAGMDAVVDLLEEGDPGQVTELMNKSGMKAEHRSEQKGNALSVVWTLFGIWSALALLYLYFTVLPALPPEEMSVGNSAYCIYFVSTWIVGPFVCLRAWTEAVHSSR